MTIRTYSALTALFADNTSGDISPQDLRDFLDSAMGVYGGIEFKGGSTAQTIAAGVPEILTEWTGNSESSNGVTPAFASDILTIDNTGIYQVSFDVSFQGVTNCIQQFELRIDGATTGHLCQRKTSNTDIGSAGFRRIVSLTAAEALSIWIEGDQNGNITVVEGCLMVERIR